MGRILLQVVCCERVFEGESARSALFLGGVSRMLDVISHCVRVIHILLKMWPLSCIRAWARQGCSGARPPGAP